MTSSEPDNVPKTYLKKDKNSGDFIFERVTKARFCGLCWFFILFAYILHPVHGLQIPLVVRLLFLFEPAGGSVVVERVGELFDDSTDGRFGFG